MIFNQEQLQALHHKDGPMLVLAGPGSGKTAVITARTAWLIRQPRVSPSSVLVVTFTKAAAKEMKERFLRLEQKTGSPVQFGTFHGIFYGILKQAYRLSGNHIASDEERLRILRSLLEESDLETEDEREVLELLQREISTVKTEQIPLEHFYSASCPAEEFRRIFRAYRQCLYQKRLLDFDDLMVYCYDLFVKRPDILKQWQTHFRYILVDEFQDINLLQYRIIRMLAAPEHNLFAVGDDDQSIYRFRGAKPEIMFRFREDYPETALVVLHQNYRCTRAVVQCSRRLIEHNTARFAKQLTTNNPQGEAVELAIFKNEAEESDYLIKCIRAHLEQGCACSDIALLVRTNLGSRPLVAKLMEYNLPFVLRDGLPNLYEHWIARQILAYLRLAEGSRLRSDFLLIANKPNRYISREALYEREVSFEQLYQFYEDKTWMCERIEKLEEDLKLMAGMTPFAAINYIRCGVGYNDYLKEYAVAHRIKAEELSEVLDELHAASRSFLSFTEWENAIHEYTARLNRQKRRGSGEGILVSTLHGAKGLEFPHVYILDVNEGVIPYHKAVLEEEVEEERRLLYVGMTRAQKTLHLFGTKKRYEKKQEPSRFLQEIIGEHSP